MKFKNSSCKEDFWKWRIPFRNKAQEYIKAKKREQFHKVEWDIDLESVELEPITLFKIDGDEITSFSDIDESWKLLVISLDGEFKGLRNTLRPEDHIKQRIVKEKQTRNSFKAIQNEFSNKVLTSNKCKEIKELNITEVKTPNLLKNEVEITTHHYPMINDQYRNKIRSKTKYYKGFNPTFYGGLKHIEESQHMIKMKIPSKPQTLQIMNKQISKLSSKKEAKKTKDVFKDYANKKSIHEVTLEMMDNLEKQINDTVDDYISNLKSI